MSVVHNTGVVPTGLGSRRVSATNVTATNLEARP